MLLLHYVTGQTEARLCADGLQYFVGSHLSGFFSEKFKGILFFRFIKDPEFRLGEWQWGNQAARRGIGCIFISYRTRNAATFEK